MSDRKLIDAKSKQAYNLPMNAYDLDQVIKHFGSGTALAKALGIKPSAVYQWKRVPPRRALEIEKLTQGVFKASLATDATPKDAT